MTAHLSKFSENPSSVNLIPPKHPSTTKHKSTEKNQSNKQNYFMKTSKNIENQDSRQYFMKKEKIETFETE